MQMSLQIRAMIAALLSISVLTVGCATRTTAPGASRLEDGRWYGDEIAYTTLRAVYLHAAKLGGNKDLSDHLAQWLASTLHLYEATLSEPGLVPQKDAERIWRQLRFMAVLQEKYPIELWSIDERVLRLLARARTSDPEDLIALRRQNWNQSFLINGISRN